MRIDGVQVRRIKALPDAAWRDPDKASVDVLEAFREGLSSLAAPIDLVVCPEGLLVELLHAILGRLNDGIQERMWNPHVDIATRRSIGVPEDRCSGIAVLFGSHKHGTRRNCNAQAMHTLK